ncbi:cation:proton antiporter [Allomeiothermus silvanus]|uniref:cation:proton antiporter domain-containing protein n=1 Tax=Allomeiothermus silvanus TaxID=52022 RepID=UPI0023F4CA98|nr:cation:proton antiporter [Allomeiothermus silvanus]
MPLSSRLRWTLPLVALGGWALAAGEGPGFFGELAVLMVISAGIAFASFRLGLVPIVSFLLAGVIIGPGVLGIVQDPQLINAAAEIGVVLLLFTIGIEFSLERLARIARLIFVGGGLQVGLTLALTTGLLALLGVSWREGVFTGCLLALSSTAIVMKLLSDRGETNSPAGQASLGILIFQDLAVVAMVLVVPMLGRGGGAGGEILGAFVKAVAIIALILTLARRVIPAFLELVARTCSREVFLLVVIALCFGTAYLTSLAGLSLALGAFLAGLLVSESRFGQQALGEILPLQILFSAAFFISVGLLFDPSFLLSSPFLVLGAILGVLGLKVAVTALSTRVLGYPLAVSAQVGLLLAQVGEFSFVLERVGREAGLNAFGIPQEGSQVFVALTVLLMAATPFLAGVGRRVGAPAAQTSPPTPQIAHGAFDYLDRHVILAGYGAYGRRLADTLNRSGEPFLILTLSPDGANQAEEAGYPVLRGDYANPHILGLAGVGRARIMVIPDDEPSMIYRVAAVVRANHPDLPIVARTRFEEEVPELERAGVSQVLPEERLTAQELLARVMGATLTTDATGQILREAPRPEDPRKKAGILIQLSEAQLASTNCAHLEWAHAVLPSNASACADCQKLGDTWVHLRVCMTCGYVGCCDDSKNKHARQHFQNTGHPIIKSLEKGEGWAWCFVDEKLL